MIICNSCGTPLSDSLRFCSECGTPAPAAAQTLPYGSSVAPPAPGYPGVAPPASDYGCGRPDYPPVVAPPSPAPYVPGGPAPRPAAAPGSNAKIALVVVGVLIIAVIAITAIVITRSRSKETVSGSRDANASPENVAASLQSAITSGRLVTGGSDDAYTYFFLLQKVDPRHHSLSDVKPRVLPQLRAIGNETFKKRAELALEIIDESEWTRAAHAYEWAHALEQSDKAIEARSRYAAAHVARLQAKSNEAQTGFYEATQLDPSWALPQNDLGYLYALNKSYNAAIPYYQRAINLESSWDIPYNNLAAACYYLRKYDDAEAWSRKAIELNAQWATPHAWLASVYETKKLKDAAIQELQTALNLYNPNRDRLRTAEIEDRIKALQSMP